MIKKMNLKIDPPIKRNLSEGENTQVLTLILETDPTTILEVIDVINTIIKEKLPRRNMP